jgi:hypothetical protein
MNIEQITRSIVGSGQRQNSVTSPEGIRKSFGWFVTENFCLSFEVEKFENEKKVLRETFTSVEKALAFYNEL